VPGKGAQIDMVAVRKADGRLALIEMKFGDGALVGDAGIEKHLQDMIGLSSDEYENMRQSAEEQLRILCQFKLLEHAKEIKVSADKPEYIILLANTTLQGKKIMPMLNSCGDIISKNKTLPFDLKFFEAKYAGYGLYKEHMLDIDEMNPSYIS
jgi:hypothetical protein